MTINYGFLSHCVHCARQCAQRESEDYIIILSWLEDCLTRNAFTMNVLIVLLLNVLFVMLHLNENYCNWLGFAPLRPISCIPIYFLCIWFLWTLDALAADPFHWCTSKGEVVDALSSLSTSFGCTDLYGKINMRGERVHT